MVIDTLFQILQKTLAALLDLFGNLRRLDLFGELLLVLIAFHEGLSKRLNLLLVAFCKRRFF